MAPNRRTPIRSERLVLVLAGFAVAVVALVGTVLLWRYREATLEGAAETEEVRVEARAIQLAEELDALVREVARLSQLAEFDLADGDLEPEKAVLRLARRDSAVLSVGVVVLDDRGGVVWAEPRQAHPAAGGEALVAVARGRDGAVVRPSAGEIAVVAPVAGRGAIAALVDGRGGRDLFGAALRRALGGRGAVSLVHRSAGGEEAVSTARAGRPPPPLRLDAAGQAWVTSDGERWLVTEADVGADGLRLRQILSAAEVEGALAAPFRMLVWLVMAALVLAAAGGVVVAATLSRLEHTELELARARDLAAMGKTAGAIAHEVKNALNGLSVGVDVLATGRADAETTTTVHRRARAEIARLRDVADDLTLFAATPGLSLRELDLGALCAEVREAVADLADDCGVTVRAELPPAPIVLAGDRPKLLSALVNLARNGIEAMGPGAFGEPLGAPAAGRGRVLELEARRADGEAIVEVSDRGAGVAPEVRRRLFEPFVTTKRTGTGLGLVIVRRVVEAHGGRVTVQDRSGGGTTFRVALPMRSP
ncbi:MAG TPA: ATP-binding protein [Anaeromyxobacteraceae bacterium]|nr:ATP-binding protein [Anaeromyxobacteraceae bacterium]